MNKHKEKPQHEQKNQKTRAGMTHSLAKSNLKKSYYLQDLSAEPLLLLGYNKQRFHLLKQNNFFNNEKYPQRPLMTYQGFI